MAMDWREILRFSEKELKESEKDKLCEGLSWMEVDDIELSFTDLKILFKLAQDVLKYKNEQVNSAMDKLNKTKRKIRTKDKGTLTESPAKSSDSVLETIEHQEEIIKANKHILEQLYIDIAELEEKKNKHEKDNDFEPESNSSRATLSEMNAIATLESFRRIQEIAKRSYIRKSSSTRSADLNNTEPLYVDTNAEAVPYRAMYKYRPQNPDELELMEGETVYVLEKCDDGWYVGSSQRTGRFGTFPGNYVERI